MAQGEAGGEPRVGAGVNKRLLLEVGQRRCLGPGQRQRGWKKWRIGSLFRSWNQKVGWVL